MESESEPSSKKTKVEDSNLDNDETTDQVSEETINSSEPKVSKRQLKKLKKKEMWEQNKKAKREKEKAKRKLKIAEAIKQNKPLGPNRKELKLCTMATSLCKVNVVVDLSFDDLMGDRDIGKCIKQILRCYSLNRRSGNPMQFYITSFDGKSSTEMQKHAGFKNWDVHFKEDSYEKVFDKESIVYLTSESENTIDNLKDGKAYIIGGLVDHNKHKGYCHQLAQEKNIAHGRLPIDEYLDMKTRKVLTIDHVFEIMLNVTQGLTWKDAFLKVIPARKGAAAKPDSEDETV